MKAAGLALTMCASAPMLFACASSKLEPQMVSSAGLPGYSIRYPAALTTTQSAFDAEEQDAEKLSGEFATYPDHLSNPNWATVRDVYQLADTDGKSSDYVERVEQSQDVASFFNEQKPEIERRIGGAAQYALKDKQCDVDVATPVRFAFERSVEKQLEDSVHDRSDAYAAIDQSEDALGKKNVEPLRTQTDAISRASYLVNVGMVHEMQKIDRMVADGSDVKSTLGRTIDDLNKVIADPKTPDARKKAATQELATAQASQAALDQALTNAKNAQKTLQDRIKKVRDDYAKAFEALEDKVKASIK